MLSKFNQSMLRTFQFQTPNKGELSEPAISFDTNVKYFTGCARRVFLLPDGSKTFEEK